jgi:predicted nucleic acid-binding protein
MIFVDTSVIVAASTSSDIRQEACLDALAIADAQGGACATHTLAEVFSILSGRPIPQRMSPVDAARIVAHTAERLTVVSLTKNEYLGAIQTLSKLGHSGGMIYDALLLASARKSKATRIYTFNLKHFRMLAPDLASCIVEP